MPVLRYSPTSPYVRKVMMVAHERGLADRLTLQPTVTAEATDLVAQNPLRKVPTLVLETGEALYDSPVICEWLDTQGVAGVPVFPTAGPARWAALRQQALGDGICDAAVAVRGEQAKPEGSRHQALIDAQLPKVIAGLDALEAEAPRLGYEPTIGTLALMAALGYVDFRHGALAWRDSRPLLAAWFARASDRPSFAATRPPQ